MNAVVRALRGVHWYLKELTGEASWDHYLERLEIAARGDDPGRDTWLDGMT